jgi:hypothetical protein
MDFGSLGSVLQTVVRNLLPEDTRRLMLLCICVNTVFTADHADSSHLRAQLGITSREK